MTAWGVTNDCYDLAKKYKNKPIKEEAYTTRYGWWRPENYIGVFPKLTIENNDPNLKVCKKNACYCNNGTPTELCPTNNLHKCKSCNTGYYLLNNLVLLQLMKLCLEGQKQELLLMNLAYLLAMTVE